MPAKKVHFTEEDGHQLAVDMLREIQAYWDEYFRLTWDAAERKGREPGAGAWRNLNADILGRYLATVQAHGSRELERGFFAVLNDYLGSAREGCVDLDAYEKVSWRTGRARGETRVQTSGR